MKKILYVMMFVFCLYIASAYDEGDFITDNQLNNIDAEALTHTDLQCRSDGINGYYRGEQEWVIPFTVSCLTIMKINTSHYIIDRKEIPITVREWSIEACRVVHGAEECEALYMIHIRNHAFLFVNHIKSSIYRMQIHKDEPNYFSRFVGYNPFEEDE